VAGDRDAIPSRTASAVAPEDTARRSLAYIRDTLERSASFTAVPGWGNVAIGVVGLVAAGLAVLQTDFGVWLLIWLVAALVSLVIGAVTVSLKAVRIGMPVMGGAGRKFFFGLAPALFSGAVLTGVLYELGVFELLPALWLLLYGAAILSAGVHSILVIRGLGLALMLLGVAAFFTPPSWGDTMMALGFGAGHIVAGLTIVFRYERGNEE